MGLFIRRSPEPLSARALNGDPDSQVFCAPSQAGRQLAQELRRYCNGHIQGRSFLIAGHRGAGKTTMVADVLTEALKRAQQGELSLRPLPVMLHGPSLFEPLPSEMRAAVRRDAEAPDPAASATPAEPSRPLAEQDRIEMQARMVLTHVVLGLHRAVVREFSASYRRALAPELGGRSGARMTPAEAGELAAQFELELMENPPASRLRELWELVGALEHGVLFPAGRAANTGAFSLASPPDQGGRELVALNGICNAHQRISGVLSGGVTETSNQSRETEASNGLDLKADTLKPAVSALSGAVVAGGTAAGGSAGLAASLMLGLGTALLSSWMFKRSSTHKGKRERKVDRSFLPDLSVRTLDRVIPVLLDRLRAAGLAPVFVIDELDKIDNLRKSMWDMVRFLKKLMAETVFTCFLTDRGYLESLRLTESSQAYGMTSSYFSHPLLVMHEPGDLDVYLDRALEVPPSSAPADRADKEILKWVLRHRSQLHALRLNREIAALDAGNGTCSLPTDRVRQLYVYRIDATLQVAIEHVLGSPAVVSWSMQRPSMRSTLLDALYRITRVWLQGAPSIDLSDAAKELLRAELCHSMNLDEAETHTRGTGEAAHGPHTNPSALDDQDLTFLLDQVRAVAQLLSTASAASIESTWPRNPLQGIETTRAPRPAQVVLQALLLGEANVLINKGAQLYEFRYWPSGLRRDVQQAPLRDPADIAASAQPLLAFLQGLDEALSQFLAASSAEVGGASFRLLCDELRLLPQTPPWEPALAAVYPLQAAALGPGNSVELEEHLARLAEFVQMLRDHLEALGHALSLAAFLVGLQGVHDFERRLRVCLRVLADGLQFEVLDSRRIRLSMGAFQQQLRDAGAMLPEMLAFDQETGQLPPDGDIHMACLDGVTFAEGHGWAAAAERAWTQLAKRLAAEGRGPAPPAPGFDEILCAASGIGPSMLLPVRTAEATPTQWTQLLMLALKIRPSTAAKPTDVPDVPFAMTAPALLHLGFGRMDPSGIAPFCRQLLAIAGGTEAQGEALLAAVAGSDAQPREAASRGSVVVIRREDGSTTDAWRAPPLRACFLVLGIDDLRRVQEQAAAFMAALPPPIRAVWERGDFDGQDTEVALAQEVHAWLSVELTVRDGSWWAPFRHARGAEDLYAALPPSLR